MSSWVGYSDRSGSESEGELLFAVRPYGDRVLKFDSNWDLPANFQPPGFHLVANLG